MPYAKYDKKMLAKVHRIILMNGEVFVEHYHRRLSENYYFIKSLGEFKDLLNRTGETDFVTIYKNNQLTLRGFPDEHFEAKVLTEYLKMLTPDYLIYDYISYPKELELYGSGSSLQELSEDIQELLNHYRTKLQFCFGPDPRTIYRKLSLNEDDEIIVVSG